MHYYRHDLALIHDRGQGQHANRCAPGILGLLAPVAASVAPSAPSAPSATVEDILVLELGCGSGALTRHLLAAGFRVIATDASPDMLELARANLGPDVDLRRLTLPDDPLPAADAVVSVGHAVSYLPDAAAVDRALVATAAALRPGGVLAIDICDQAFGELPPGTESSGRTAPDWAVISQYSRPSPDKFVRDITTFVPDGHGAWRRDSEHHENVLVDTSHIPALLGEHGVTATVRSSFGVAELPPGLVAVTGRKLAG
jgi:SAM-dependent methyltransferase